MAKTLSELPVAKSYFGFKLTSRGPLHFVQVTILY